MRTVFSFVSSFSIVPVVTIIFLVKVVDAVGLRFARVPLGDVVVVANQFEAASLVPEGVRRIPGRPVSHEVQK